MKSKLIIIAELIALFGSAQAANIQVSNAQKQIYGTVTDVTASGVPENFNPNTVVGDYAVFDMVKDGQDYADLKITYVRDGGGLGANVMIARTTNSQTLTDSGTVTILLNTTDQSACGGCFRFDWYAPGSFVGGVEQTVGNSALLQDAILYTTFDIDFRQFVAPAKAVLDSYTLTTTTLLTAVPVAATADTPERISFQDSGADSIYTNVTTAVQFLTKSGIDASHSIGMGKQISDGNALFMFEFRDPSTILPGFTGVPIAVPEPSGAVLLSVALLAGLGVRRRRQS